MQVTTMNDAERNAPKKQAWKSSESAKERMRRDGIVNGRRVQPGKTEKDRANGAKQKNAQNKDTRAMWQTDSKRSKDNFPRATCNGKKNRYQVTGKGGETVYLGDKKK